jgi:quercetin dioxygenase-like cupin family protein
MTITNPSTFTANLRELADYSKPGVTRKALIQDEQTRFALICLSAGTQMPEHTAARNVSITVIAGRGILTLAGQEVTLEPGVFVYMPANTPHALQSIENLAFLHT